MSVPKVRKITSWYFVDINIMKVNKNGYFSTLNLIINIKI